MANVRLAMIIRKDLQLSEGLLAAQSFHVGMEWLRQMVLGNIKIDPTVSAKSSHINLSCESIDWMESPYVAVLGVYTYEELQHVRHLAEEYSVPYTNWRDTIPSKAFEGQVFDTDVGLSLGPSDNDAIRKVSGTLPLY